MSQELRAAYIGVSTAGEPGLVGRSDPELFAIAAAEGHVLLTEPGPMGAETKPSLAPLS